MSGILRWLSGGTQHAYYALYLCMNGDTAWIYQYIASGVFVFFSYASVFVFFLWRYRKMRKTRFAKAMLFGAVVFFWCGISGYLMNGLVGYFVPLKRLEVFMRYFTGCVNIYWAYHLYKISFIETILSIDPQPANIKGESDANNGQ